MSSPDRRGDAPAVGWPAGCPTARRRRLQSDEGAQALEFAMVLPLLALALVVVVGVALLGATAVHTQALAYRLARHAAIAADADVLADVRPEVRAGAVVVDIDPPSGVRAPGDVLTVRLQRRVRLLWPPGITVPLQATATALTEDVG